MFAITLKTETDGTLTLIVYVDGVAQMHLEQLLITQGMHGFTAEGSEETDNAIFSKLFQQKAEYYVNIDDALSAIRVIPYKDLVGKNGTQQDYYDYIRALIERVSRFFDYVTDKNDYFFQRNGISVTEYFDGKGAEPSDEDFTESIASFQRRAASFLLNQRPVITITSIHENKSDVGTTDEWTEITGYRLRSSGQLVVATGAIPQEGVKNVRVIYQAGYEKTPENVKSACTQLIENYVKKLISDKSATFVSFARPQAINFASSDVLTPDIKMIIQNYKTGSWGTM